MLLALLRPKVMLLLMGACLLSACSTVQQTQSTPETDPWEGMNRAVFKFNDTLDGYLLKPTAKGYRAITPDLVETGFTNFFSNLFEIRNVVNDVLQWKWGHASNNTGRFLVNSTLGIGGFFDVASHMSLEKLDDEDFGQTLAHWGVNDGPYFVIPFLGPSTVRDTAGLPLDWQLSPISYIDHVPTRNTTQAFKFVVDRANLLNAEEFVSGDRYTFIREAYLQRRTYLINDGVSDDEFGGDDFGSDFDDFEE